MGGKKSIPPGVRGAVLADTGWELLANLRQTGIDLGRGGIGGLHVLLADLLLDEGAGDQLVKSLLPGQIAEAASTRIKNREPDLVVEVTGQDGMVVDDGDHSVKDDRLSGRLGEGLRWYGKGHGHKCQQSAQPGHCRRGLEPE